MPQLSDLVGKKKKFLKKNYRPWDFSGSGTLDNTESSVNPPSKNNASIAKPHAIENIKAQPNSLEDSDSLKTVSLTGNKTGNKTDNKEGTTRKQTDNKLVTERKQPDNISVTTRLHLDNKRDNVTDNAIQINYLIESIKKLSGIQKKIFLYIIDICTARGALDTGNVLSMDLAQYANCSFGSAKTSLNRLIEKKLILRLQGKACRGGHLVLGVTKEIQAAAIQAQQALFNPLKGSNPGNVTDNNTGNNQPYSSSSYNINTTTSLPPEWSKINFESLRQIGFSETQLRQLYDSSSNSPEIVQASIYHFAFALENKEKVKNYSDPLNVLMGVLRKGQCWFETDYVSPQELSLQKLLEEKRKQKEKIESMIKELVELEFPDWKKKLSQDEIKQIVPEHTLKTNMTTAINAVLRMHFTETVILPKLEKDGLIDKTS